MLLINRSELKKVVKEAMGGDQNYPGQIRRLKDEVEELKTKKKMEEREIQHLVKLKEEKLDLEHQKKELDLDKAYSDKVLELQEKHHSKVMSQIEAARKEMKEVYEKIMERLPNITAALEIKKSGR